MRVAVVQTSVSASLGGRFTFQETLIDAIRATEQETNHEFIFYSRGLSLHSDSRGLRLIRRAAEVAATRSVEFGNDLQDRAFGRRLRHLRTSLDRRLEADGVDIVWFPTMYAEQCDRPFIYTVLDVEHLRQPWFPEAGHGAWERRQDLLERYARRATRVIVPNQAGMNQLETLFRIQPDRMLRLPHPTPQFALEAGARPPASAELLRPLGVRPPYLFYPAQYWPHKNHATLLQTLRELGEAWGGLQVVCVGADKGSLAHVRATAIQLGLASRVHHLGFVSVSALIALYQHAHALVYLSLFGPENLPPLEAFALGCPVIASDIPGAREQLGEAAILVPPTDANVVAAAVRSLADDEVRQRLVDAGRKRAAGRTAESYVRGVVSFLDEFEVLLRCWR